MTSIPTLKLNTGASVPAIALGCFAGVTQERRAAAQSWFVSALKAGYRHLDTAAIYGTEKMVGDAIRESGVPREEIFVTTKLAWYDTQRVTQAIDESLQKAGLDYFDLYLIHFPHTFAYEEGVMAPKNPDGTYKLIDHPFNETWAEMEKVLETGKTRAIGVSNFSIKTIEQLLKTAKVVPALLQVELHPYLAQNALVDYCLEKGIQISAYTPSGYDKVRSNPVIIELANKYKVSPNQIILAWHMSRDTVAVVKSANVERQKENITLPTLAAEDLKRISELDRNERITNKADANGTVYGWTYEQLGW